MPIWKLTHITVHPIYRIQERRLHLKKIDLHFHGNRAVYLNTRAWTLKSKDKKYIYRLHEYS